MWLADKWQDYTVIDTSDGEKLERWGKYTLIRPDPQVIWKTEKKDPLSNFLLDPKFDVTRSDEAGEISFASKWYEYFIETRSFDDPLLSDAYFEFINVYTKLNLYLNPGVFTPMARMAVNDLLTREKRFPAKIRLILYPKGKALFAKPDIITSEHKIIRRLAEEDLGRIVRATHFAEQFPKITFGNYYQTVIQPQP